jgi:hypothetical protein
VAYGLFEALLYKEVAGMKTFLYFILTAGLILGVCSCAATQATPASTPESGKSVLSSITVAPITPSSDTTRAYEPPPLASPPQYVIIKTGLVFGNDQPGTHIPLGSTIYHWKNKITEVIGPDNSVLFICKDAETAQIPTPGGSLQPATRVLQVPNGAMISADKDNKSITKIYSGNDVIGTIVDKPEDFPYAPTQIRNTEQQYVATGTYADGTTSDVTSKVTWSSSDTAIATISSNGLVTTLVDGNTTITGSLDGITSIPVDLTVNSLSSVSIITWKGIGAPRTLTSLPVGSTFQVWATGTYSDGSDTDITSQVNWVSSNEGVATIDANGLITGVSDGSDNITASLSGITSPPVAFMVVSLSSITVTPPPVMTIGSKMWLSAEGVYSDGSTGGIQATWGSSDPSVATISTDGLVTAMAEGTTGITASLNGIISEPATLTVVAAS